MRQGLEPYATTGVATRLAGADRYATAAAISSTYYTPGVQAAFIATGAGFADALAGGPAAALNDSPLLLVRTEHDSLGHAAELTRLNPQRIYVLGGTAVDQLAVGRCARCVHRRTRDRACRARIATPPAPRSSAPSGSKSRAYVATGLTSPTRWRAVPWRAQPAAGPARRRHGGARSRPGQEILRLGSHRLTIIGGRAAVSSGAENGPETAGGHAVASICRVRRPARRRGVERRDVRAAEPDRRIRCAT